MSKLCHWLLIVILLALSACAGLPQPDPVQVYVVGVQPLQGQGLEFRMMVQLRVQNPNDTPIVYDGISIAMDLQGKPFASGVSDAAGSVPRFGESVISVPVSVSALRVLHRALETFATGPRDTIEYELRGKLAAPAFKSLRFTSKGAIALPEEIYAPDGDRAL